MLDLKISLEIVINLCKGEFVVKDNLGFIIPIKQVFILY